MKEIVLTDRGPETHRAVFAGSTRQRVSVYFRASVV